MDAATSAAICSAALSTGGIIITAIIKGVGNKRVSIGDNGTAEKIEQLQHRFEDTVTKELCDAKQWAIITEIRVQFKEIFRRLERIENKVDMRDGGGTL